MLRHIKKVVLGGAAAVVAVAGAGGVALASTPSKSQPYIVLSSYYGHPGDSFTARGYDFGHDEAVTISLHGKTGTVHTNKDGYFDRQFSVGTVPAGSYDLTATGVMYHESAKATYKVGGYYGVAEPSSYYVLPRQGLSIKGKDFQPGEPVSVKNTSSGTSEAGVKADAQGKFQTPSRMVPYNQANTKQTYEVKGLTSGSSSTFTVSVGTYYPEITPASYYVSKGESVKISGKNFAPFEGVRLFVNGQLAAKATAGGDGSLGSTGDLTVKAPGNGKDFTVTATGMQVGDSVSRTITLKQ